MINTACSRYGLFLLFLLLPLVVLAAPEVTFDIQPRVLRVGETALCTLTVRGDRNPATPGLPHMEAFQVSGPSVQNNSSTQIINGKATHDSSVSFQFQLMALQTGNHTIGPFTYRIGGKALSLPAIDVNVVGEQTNGATPLYAKLSATRPYFYTHEVFDLILSIYYQPQLELGQNIRLHNLESTGLELQQFEELPAGREVVNGQIYGVQSYRCRTRALTAGTFMLAPTLQVPLVVRNPRQRRDSFFGFFDRVQTQDRNIRPQPLELTIKPLPTKNRPKAFNGAVGTFVFDVDAKPTELDAGDPITLTMTISGAGNLATITSPQVETDKNFKTYDPTLLSKDLAQDSASGRKIFEQVVIPQTDSVTNLPALIFCYFDPITETYRELTGGPFPLTVRPSNNRQPRIIHQVITDDTPAQTRILGRDIVYLKPAPHYWIKRTQPKWFQSPMFWLLQVVPVTAVVIIFLTTRRKDILVRDIAKARRHKAPRSARAGLHKARQAITNSDVAGFHEAAWETLSSYFGNRFNLSPGEISATAVVKRMREAGLDDNSCEQLTNAFHVCEYARFGQTDTSATEDADLLTQNKALHTILKRCERIRT